VDANSLIDEEGLMKGTLLLILWQCCPLPAFAPQEAPPPPAPADPQSITLPASTPIAIRTVDAIDSKKADVNREYAASLDDPLVVNSVTVAPVDAHAFVRVADVKNSKVGRSSLKISLTSVVINGEKVKVNTDKVDSQSGTKAKRIAISAAAGAGVGAAIGASAGAVGAGVGAGIGAAAGTVTGAVTGGGLVIPSETRFSFKLAEPVAVNYLPKATPSASADAALPPIVPPPPPSDEPVVLAQSSPPPQSPAVPSGPLTSAQEPELIGVVYLRDESGGLISLERTTGVLRTRRVGLAIGYSSEMPGATSPVRLKNGQKPIFVVRLANGIDPGKMKLYPLDSTKQIRRTKTDPKNRLWITVQLNITQVGASTYALAPVKDLPSGEYCFSPDGSNDAYCFGSDTGWADVK
jgi:uncharacterized membrane protein